MPLPEKSLIAEIRRMAGSAGNRARRMPRGHAGEGARATPGRSVTRVIAGIGDDCAVLRIGPGQDWLVTTDFSLEGVHFRRDWHPAESVGHRCLARGLSDIAAMGGEPVEAFLSLALPRDVPQAWVRGFMRGLLRLARRYGIALAGGDTAESARGILADIVVVGSVPKGKAVMRSGARAGDKIYVTGELGGSAAAIAQMSERSTGATQRQTAQDPSLRQVLRVAQDFGARLRRRAAASSFVRDHAFMRGIVSNYPRHFFPEPRLQVGRALREKGWATAMIDLSDGLSTDLAHICEESGVAAEIEIESIPRARVGKPARKVDLELALHGGEDYELLFTARAAVRVPARIAGVTVTCIGRMVRGSARVMARDAKGKRRELKAQGWEHFGG
jgi:thiamine-monophosphate kinase